MLPDGKEGIENETGGIPMTIFRGWLALDKESINNGLQLQDFEPKKWQETDIDVKITHCGLCGSDISTLRSGWAPTEYPCCVGHEVIGEVVRVGKSVERDIKHGERVGVGPVVYVCGDDNCHECRNGMPNYCPKRVQAYNGRFPDGSKSYGGLANYCRVPGAAAIRIPAALSSEAASVMLCAGITPYVPLKKYQGSQKRVGIIGVGGLGHFGIMFAKSLGYASVIAISRRENKRSDAFSLGADTYIATEEEEGWVEKYSSSLDVIISTVSSANMPLNHYLSLLRSGGHFCQVGLPEQQFPTLEILGLCERNISIHFSDVGSVDEVEKMLQFAAKEKIRPWVETRQMSDVNQVLRELEAGKAKYRYVLVNDM